MAKKTYYKRKHVRDWNVEWAYIPLILMKLATLIWLFILVSQFSKLSDRRFDYSGLPDSDDEHGVRVFFEVLRACTLAGALMLVISVLLDIAAVLVPNYKSALILAAFGIAVNITGFLLCLAAAILTIIWYAVVKDLCNRCGVCSGSYSDCVASGNDCYFAPSDQDFLCSDLKRKALTAAVLLFVGAGLHLLTSIIACIAVGVFASAKKRLKRNYTTTTTTTSTSEMKPVAAPLAPGYDTTTTTAPHYANPPAPYYVSAS